MPALALKWRLMAATMGLVSAALFIALLAMLFEMRDAQRGALLDAQRSTTDVIAQSASVALAFGDPQAAAEVLATLAADPHAIGAVLHDQRGAAFARWARPGLVLADDLPEAGTDHAFLSDRLVVRRPVAVAGEQIGHLQVISDLQRWQAAQRRHLQLVSGLLVLMLALSAVFAYRLQARLTSPIDGLLATVNQVTRTEDFSIRASRQEDDEFGRLVWGLNAMLDEIQSRDLRLQEAQADLRAQVARLDQEMAERRRVELEVRDLNDRLEHRVLERTAQLEVANAELEAFSYSVSHDLRAPLRTIHGFSEALEEEYGAQLDAEARDYLTRIKSGTRRMGDLIDDLLKLSRVARVTLVRSSVDVTALSLQVTADLRRADPGRRVEVRIEPDLRVSADPGLMEAALRNLIGNAWKFSRHRDPAHIEVGRFSEADGDVLFVRDNGAGFDMAYADRLFGAFQRLHNQEEFEGTGIGLATVKRVAARHGGRVWADSRPGVGATIFMYIPEPKEV